MSKNSHQVKCKNIFWNVIIYQILTKKLLNNSNILDLCTISFYVIYNWFKNNK